MTNFSIKTIIDKIKNHPFETSIICASAGIGAVLGIIAYNNSWLG